MARGIQIAFTLNPSEFLRGLKRIETDLDDVKDALGDVEDAGDDALDGLDTRKAERGLDRVERATDDVEDAFGKLGRGAKADLAKIDRAAQDTEREVGDIEEEANQSAKEFGASFRGDPVEALEEVQSYLSEIVAVKLPGFAGAAATIAGGAVLGLVVAGVEKWREQQERIAEYANDYLRDILELPSVLDEATAALATQKVLEEASAEQFRDINIAAAARNQTAQEYVSDILGGELTTQEALSDIWDKRRELANRIRELNLKNTAEADAQVQLLLQQDEALQDQERAQRNIGGYLNDNVKGLDAATDAALAQQGALAVAAGNADRLARNDFGRGAIESARRQAQGLQSDLDRLASRRYTAEAIIQVRPEYGDATARRVAAQVFG